MKDSEVAVVAIIVAIFAALISMVLTSANVKDNIVSDCLQLGRVRIQGDAYICSQVQPVEMSEYLKQQRNRGQPNAAQEESSH